MRYLHLALLMGAYLPLSAQNQTAQVMLQPEDSVHNMISSLPEVKALDDVYDSLSNRRQNLILHITPPDSLVPYYHVEAGYQGGTRFHPHYYFYVDLPSQTIFIEDMEHGDRTTLDEWRARRKDKQATDDSPEPEE